MLHTIFFLIEPKDEAMKAFPLNAGDFSDTLLEPLLISRSHADRSPWRENDLEAVVKILYLARLREYTPLAPDSNAESILGSSRIALNVFDRWWSIRRFRMEEGPSEAMENYLSRIAIKFVPTGNQLIDEFVNRLSINLNP